jgi:hypothetical protein
MVVGMSSVPLDMSEQNPSCGFNTWMITFMVWPHGLDSSQEYFIHISSVRPTIEFTLEVETMQFCSWTCWSSWKDLHWTLKSTENLHASCYLHFQSNHPHVKRGVVPSLNHKDAPVCQEQPDCSDKIDILRHNLQFSAFPIGFIDSIITLSKRNVRLKGEQPLSFFNLKCLSVQGTDIV